MLLLEPFPGGSRSVDAAPCGSHLLLTFVARSGFSSLTLAYWIDSLVRVSRRVGRSHFGKISLGYPQARLPFSSPINRVTAVSWEVIPAVQTSFCLLTVKETLSLVHLRFSVFDVRLPRSCNALVSTARLINCSSTASFSTVSSLLTLFSKFFSSFLRSTCSLSVSRLYLALEEVYLPFRAAFPNNPTLRLVSYVRVLPTTGLSPSLAPFF